MMGWLAAGLVMLVTVALIVGEITNAAQRSWWGSHSLTTDTVSGLLVLLITVLVVNQLLNLRQDRQQSRVVAAQAAIVVAQAAQSTRCWPRPNMLAAARTRPRRSGPYLRRAASHRVASAVAGFA